MAMQEMELEALPELEWESEWEGEGEWEAAHEGEFEAEQFFGGLAKLAARAVSSPALQRVASQAARSALGGLGPIGNVLGGLLGEGEGEEEGEWEANPIRRAYPDAEYGAVGTSGSRGYSEALMEHLGHAAAEAESEAEAEAFIGALVPLATALLPKLAPLAMKAAPQLIRAATNIAGRLFRSPSTRQLVRTMPTVMRRAARILNRRVTQGRPISPQAAVQTLANQAVRVIGSPQQCVHAYRRSRALDRRFHTVVAPISVRTARSAPCPC